MRQRSIDYGDREDQEAQQKVKAVRQNGKKVYVCVREDN